MCEHEMKSNLCAFDFSNMCFWIVIFVLFLFLFLCNIVCFHHIHIMQNDDFCRNRFVLVWNGFEIIYWFGFFIFISVVHAAIIDDAL